jgi:hypothetical protein
LAKKRAGEVADGRDPVAEDIKKRIEKEKANQVSTNTVNAVLDTFVTRHVKKLRSGFEVERAFNVYVRPRIGKKSIYDLKRRDIVEMLDTIEDENGPVMADRVLAHVRKAFNWQAARDDQFSPPIVRGMARTRPAERARIHRRASRVKGTTLGTPVLYRSGGMVQISPSISSARIKPTSLRRWAVNRSALTRLRKGSGMVSESNAAQRLRISSSARIRVSNVTGMATMADD